MTTEKMWFQQHADRDLIQAEAHARPPLAITSATAEVWHWVLDDQRGAAGPWPDPFEQESRHQIIDLDDGLLRFERHTEFVSLTFVGQTRPSGTTQDLVRACPGQQLAGARIILGPSGKTDLTAVFSDARLFGGEALFQGVEVATDFRISEDGLVTFLVGGTFADEFARGRLVKRLIDLETYRMASLLGLPVVRRAMPALEALEARAAKATRELTHGDAEGLGGQIDELAALLADVGALRESIRYRVAASQAYYAIVTARLASLDETPIGQRQTLRGFVEHRLGPAIQTVGAFDRRLADASDAVSSAMALARTRLDHAAQQQNQKLLASMERRAGQQVHLAQAVEGLSVAAITYYLVGLIGYGLKGLPDFGVHDAVIVAASIPVVAVSVWWLTRRAVARIQGLDKQ